MSQPDVDTTEAPNRYAVRLNLTWPAAVILWVLVLVGAGVLLLAAVQEWGR